MKGFFRKSPLNRLLSFAFAGLSATTVATAVLAQDVKLRLAHGYTANSVEQEALVDAAARIRERTNGGLDIQIFSDNQLGTNADAVEQAVSGADVIVFVDASGAAEKGLPELGILSGPFLFETSEQAKKFGKSDLFNEWVDKLAVNGNLRILALNWFDEPRDIIGDRPFVEPGDLNGMKIRLPPLDAWLATFVPLGAVPTNLTFGETYGALEQGVVNAAESSPNAIAAVKWPEVVKHLTRTGHIRPWLGYAMGEDAFKRLSPEYQVILVEEFNKSGEIAAGKHTAMTDATIEGMKEMGVEVHAADIPAFQEATKEFYAKSDKWPADLVDTIRELGR
jgi:TRAP-type C4-dicarboxylate transport system substrate-binding protein